MKFSFEDEFCENNAIKFTFEIMCNGWKQVLAGNIKKENWNAEHERKFLKNSNENILIIEITVIIFFLFETIRSFYEKTIK